MPALTVPPEARKGPNPRGPPKGPYLKWALGPMSSLEDMFADLAREAKKKGLAAVLEALGGRNLRVATVCSGTEAPVLAMEMIAMGKLFCWSPFIPQLSIDITVSYRVNAWCRIE